MGCRFRVHAESAEAAKAWGDHLANRRAQGSGGDDRFLRSEVRSASDPLYGKAKQDDLPTVKFGVEPAEGVIGWQR